MTKGVPENFKQRALLELAREIDANHNWWRFPEEDPVRGFLGTSSIVIVGDQPSTSAWPKSHPNRRAFYDTLTKIGVSDAHLTDLYKKRGVPAPYDMRRSRQISMITFYSFNVKLKYYSRHVLSRLEN
jgi:hypothetical protein